MLQENFEPYGIARSYRKHGELVHCYELFDRPRADAMRDFTRFVGAHGLTLGAVPDNA